MVIQDLEIMQLEASLAEYQQARQRLAAELSELRAASQELVDALEPRAKYDTRLGVAIHQLKDLLEGPTND